MAAAVTRMLRVLAAPGRAMVQRPLRRALSLPSHTVVGLPSLSPTMENGTIASWKVSEGSSFAAGDVIAEIETDKTTVDFEAQDDGVLVAAGSEVNVGDPIMVVVEDEDDVSAFKDFKADSAKTATTQAPAPSPDPAPAPPAAVNRSLPAAEQPASPANSGRVVASPRARMLARERGYDLSVIAGSVPGGRVVAAHVISHSPSPPPPSGDQGVGKEDAIRVPPSEVGTLDIRVKPESASIAARLTYSVQTAPHYYLTMEFALDAALAVLQQLNSQLDEDAQISLTDLFIKASASATKAVPAVNAAWLEGGIVRSYSRFDLNLVVGVDAGLVAPAITGVDSLGLKDVADRTKAAIAAVSDDSAPPEAYACGTFTLLNLGAFGVSSAAPIVATPQACALALGTVEDKLIPTDDADKPYAVQKTLVATLSADHRVVDGAVGAQWLQALKGLVEQPHNLLL